MKGKFDAYVLWPLAKKFQNWIIDRSTARDFTVCTAQSVSAAFTVSHILLYKFAVHQTPVDLYLIFEKLSLKNEVWQTGLLVYFELNFYCLCSQQISSLK